MLAHEAVSHQRLEPGRADPFAVLAGIFAVCANFLEPAFQMQCVRCRIRLGNAGDREMYILRRKDIEKRAVKPEADAGAAAVRLEIDAGLDRGAEGGRRPVAAAIGIAEDPGLAFGDQQTVAAATIAGEPGPATLDRVQLGGELGVDMGDIVIGDRARATRSLSRAALIVMSFVSLMRRASGRATQLSPPARPHA